MGPSLGLLALALPHPAVWNELPILALIGVAYLIAATVWVRRSRSPLAVLQAALALGTVMISLAIHFTGPGASPFVLFYIWIALFAFYFFTVRQALLQLAVLGLAYAAVPVPDHTTWWLVTMGTMAAAGGLLLLIKGRIGVLVTRLEEMARSDPLTGVPNRRGFGDALELELERARRNGLPLCLLLGDLDHFKRVNDHGGHEAGDEALCRVAELLSKGKRRIDTLARVGGEEFALLLPDTDAEGALVVAKRLQAAIREEFATAAVPIQISFGIARFPEHGQTTAGLRRAADEALYAAKRLGRDRSVVHGAVAEGASAKRVPRHIGAERYLAAVLELVEEVDVRCGNIHHSETVARYAEATARALGLPQERVERVRLAGLLHDVGKIGVAASILRNPGKLSEKEWAEVRRHPEIGASTLDDVGLADVREWVLAHHERPDGSGYPRGLAGEEIPFEARIVAIADAYEAMTNDRAYRPAREPAEAHEELLRHAGTQFDERVVTAFLGAIEGEKAPAGLAISDAS